MFSHSPLFLFFLNPFCHWLIVGLGPGGLDSDWIPENERDCYPGVTNHQTKPLVDSGDPTTSGGRPANPSWVNLPKASQFLVLHLLPTKACNELSGAQVSAGWVAWKAVGWFFRNCFFPCLCVCFDYDFILDA